MTLSERQIPCHFLACSAQGHLLVGPGSAACQGNPRLASYAEVGSFLFSMVRCARHRQWRQVLVPMWHVRAPRELESGLVPVQGIRGLGLA